MAQVNGFGWEGSDEYYDTVLREYAKMLKKNPRSPVFVSMAKTCLKNGNPKMAMAVLRKGMKHNPNLLSARLCKAQVYIVTSNYEKAEKLLLPAVERFPKNILARRLLAQLYLKTDKPGEGLEQLEESGDIPSKSKSIRRLYEKLKLLQREQRKVEKQAQELIPEPVFVKESVDRDSRDDKIIETLELWLNNARKMTVNA